MMDNNSFRKIEVIYRQFLDSPIEDEFFDDPLDALELIAHVLFDGGVIEFLAVPCVQCFDYNNKEIYNS